MAKTTTAPIDPLYEINEACERLKCSPPTLYRLDDDGEITLLKIRGKTLVAGVEALIARQLEAAELRRLAQEAGAAPPVACQITTEAPCGIVGQPPLQGRRGRKRQTEPPPDALLASLPDGGA